MTNIQAAGLYIALHLLLLVILAFRVGFQRINTKVNIGDGGDSTLLARIRAHGNYTENAPLALLGLFALASLGAPVIAIHIFGAAFLFARISHAHGMSQEGSVGKGRVIGMITNQLVLLGEAGYLLFLIFAS